MKSLKKTKKSKILFVNSMLRSVFMMGVLTVVGLSIGVGVRAWVNPTASAPGGNVGAPITTGGDQMKTGGLTAKFLASALNGSWFPYPGNNYNYLRGHTFFNGVLYDENNSAYYLDPSATSTVNAFYSDFLHTARNDSWFPYPGNNYNYLRGHTFFNGVLYDENNPAYYLSPSGTSVVNGLTAGAGLNNNNKRLTNVATPIAGTDAVNKDYVDGKTFTTGEAWYGSDGNIITNSGAVGPGCFSSNDHASCPVGMVMIGMDLCQLNGLGHYTLAVLCSKP